MSRIISTPEEFDALPKGSKVRHKTRRTHVKLGGSTANPHDWGMEWKPGDLIATMTNSEGMASTGPWELIED